MILHIRGGRAQWVKRQDFSIDSGQIISQILIKPDLFSRDLKNVQTLNFMQKRLVGAELLHADKQTDIRTAGQTSRHNEANRQKVK